MTQLKACLKGFFVFFTVLGTFLALSLTPALAQEEDPGLLRTLETDSAPVENSYYLWASFNSDLASPHRVYFYGEGLFVLGKDWGLEADFPVLIIQEPLGEGPAVLGPVGLFLRYEAWHFGSWSSETAGAFSIQGGGAYGFSNPTFPSVGSSWALKALGGFRVERFFIQGNYGYRGGIDPKVASMWQLNTGLGYRLNPEWYIQTEADLLTVAAPSGGSSWSFIPQVAFQPGDWLFELGESFGDSPSAEMEIMVARVF